MSANAMDYLLVLGALGEIHAASAWAKTPIEELVEEIQGFAGRARDAPTGVVAAILASRARPAKP